MSGKFKVGEVLMGQNHVIDTEYNGMECTVVLGLMMQRVVRRSGSAFEMAYQVIWANGKTKYSAEGQLRRKQPPAGEQSVLDMFKLPSPSKEIA